MLIIPRGKKVNIFNSGDPVIDNTDFKLESDINIKFLSSYATLTDILGIDPNLLTLGTLISSSINSATGSSLPSAGFKQVGFQQWTGTEPITFTMDIGLYMETNAYEDVVVPAKAFAKLALPTEVGNLGGLVAPGPSALSMIFENQNQDARHNLMTIKFGALTIHSCIIYGIDWLWSGEVDEWDYPIWCKMKCDCKTMWTATTNDIDNMLEGNGRRFI
jgi:hypothetical protein